MRSPDHTDAQRIEALLAGAPPESEREAQLEGLVRQLRAAAPPAPPSVRERVRTLREPERRRFAWRPALVALPIAAAIVAGAFGLSRGGSSGGDAESAGAEATSTVPFATGGESHAELDALSPRDGRAVAPPALESAQLGAADSAAGGRAQEWDVALELRVRDNDRLSDASADAIRTTRELGGFVVSSNVSTRERSGEARLVLRVPSRRIQDAIARLSELGTITAQQVAIQDRQDELDRLRRRIDDLRVQRAEVDLRLRTESLTQPERLRLELQRQRLTGRLNSLTADRNNVTREVALAEISLTVRTGRSAAAPSEGRLEGAAGDALHVLAVAGAVAIFVLIVISPLVAIGIAVWLGRRSMRRREHERLLDQTNPAAARD
jgi:Domain of unknown function (DUF4349)